MIIHGIVSSTEDVLCSFLSAISQCASLSRIWLDGRLTPNSIDLFKQLEQLKTLQLSLRGTALRTAPFLRSCNLPRLQSLDIELRDQSSCSGAADVMVVEDFHSLEHLKMKGPCSELFKLLGHISTQLLKTMFLSFMPSRMASSQDIVACIQECGRLGASLRDLELTGTSLRNDLSILPGALAPIKCCTMLRTFKFSAAMISLKDDNIHQLCGEGNWRHLEVLELPHCVRGEAPSLLSLITLTEHCPQLRRISLCIDLALQDYESLQAQKTLPHLPTNLTHLSILKPMEDSSVSHYLNTVMLAVSVSDFLDHWFPKLIPDNIVAPTADQEWWRGVKTMMGKYRQIREEMVSKAVN
ncbi:hypothetical protein NLJ89_g2341 [Agrocybe chaxingu]|uniref:Uncharacterized protein n=1 Tax=Agrocybe chaxingu TaxID=84603 RepID=A0A9W8MXQ6_9AGAR|nr:hypothetical protein NLJ89_g2341 [Agrocybe chaxingu]